MNKQQEKQAAEALKATAAEHVRATAAEFEASDADPRAGTTERAVRWQDFRLALDRYCEIHNLTQ